MLRNSADQFLPNASDARLRTASRLLPAGDGRVGKELKDCGDREEVRSCTPRLLPDCGQGWHTRTRDDSGRGECRAPGAARSEIAQWLARCGWCFDTPAPATNGPGPLSDQV